MDESDSQKARPWPKAIFIAIAILLMASGVVYLRSSPSTAYKTPPIPIQERTKWDQIVNSLSGQDHEDFNKRLRDIESNLDHLEEIQEQLDRIEQWQKDNEPTLYEKYEQEDTRQELQEMHEQIDRIDRKLTFGF